MLNWIILAILGLALSVPMGSAALVLGGLALEYLLGWIVEAGQAVEEDPEKAAAAKKALLVVGLVVVIVACVAIACVVAGVLWLINRGGF